MSETNYRVSIGMPVFNAENYLEEALESILSQTFSGFELIISDNASTDGTDKICRTYAERDSRIRYFRNQDNLGASKNYNRVFELSRCEYFRWAAHDDLLAPSCLEMCVSTLDQNDDAIMSYPKTILIDETGGVIEFHHDGFDLHSNLAHERFRKFFYSSAWCHPVFGLIRSDVLKRTGLIGSFGSSDKVLLGELALLGKCYEVPEHLAYRRIHPLISTIAFESDEARNTWFDPSGGKGGFFAPRARRFLEHVKSIERAQLDNINRIRCHLELIRFYTNYRRVPGVLRDTKQIFKKIWAKL